MTCITRALAIATAILTTAGGVHADQAGADPKGQKAPAPVRLRVAATTTVEIVLAWDPVPGATAYVLQRSTAPSFDPAATIALELPPEVAGYGDLGCGPHEASRFGPGHHVKEFDRQNTFSDGRPGRGGTLYYRLKVRPKGGEETTSDTVSARLADKPVRGEKGDLWADVVLGQPDFYNYNYGKVTALNVNLAGGLAIDRGTKPNRVFLLDGNNNRILGLDRLGVSSATSRPATSEEDCPPGESLQLTPGKVEPKVILGQPGANTTAANGDATMQAFPGKAPASRLSLAMSRSGAVSPGETVVFANPVVDAQHNLYVPDCYNNRVLMYLDPLKPGAGVAAHAVWGQGGDFTTHEANKGGVGPGSLRLRDIMGLGVDAKGSLWITDSFNNRVLRFSRDPKTGIPRQEADFVLGQKDFQATAGRKADELDGMFMPVGVRADKDGNVYVLDWGPAGTNERARLVVYSAKALAGAEEAGRKTVVADRVVLPKAGDPPGLLFMPSCLAYDPVRHGLWMLKVNGTAIFYDIAKDQATWRVGNGPGHLTGIDVDSAGNVFVIDNWHPESVRRYSRAKVEASSQAKPVAWDAHETVFYARVERSLDSLAGVTGLAIYGQQLVVADKYRLLWWNDYRQVVNGPAVGRAADGQWEPEGVGREIALAYPRTDGKGRLWVSTMRRVPSIPKDQPLALRAFQGPLRPDMLPVKNVYLGRLETKEGKAFQPKFQDFIYFAPVGTGDRIWIAEENGGRALRLVNVDGEEDKDRGPYVDVVLGKPDLAAQDLRNRSTRIAADSLWIAPGLRVDAEGNLWVLDKPVGDDGMGTRLLRFDAKDIPDRPRETVFGIKAKAVYGTAGRFDVGTANRSGGAADFENGAHPFLPALDGHGRMVLGTNPYGNSRFALGYLNWRENIHPQFALADTTGYTFDAMFDPDGNLYLGDWNWNRVLIYKAPLANFAPAAGVKDTGVGR
jgi:hypothetical protein